MRSFVAVCLLGACLSGVDMGEARAQATSGTAQGAQPSSGATQRRAVGEVVSVDAAARRFVVRTDAGESVTVEAGDATTISRVPPGATTQDKAVKISLSEMTAGERVFVRGDASAADGAVLLARQVVVTPAAAATAGQGGGDALRAGRGLVGQITSLNAGRREITVETRGREGGQSVTVALAGDAARVRRYAPDSLNPADAVAATFADLRVGDQLRATGERNADGTRFTAEEVVSGSILRLGGTVTAVNAAAGEITIKAEQTGQTHTVAVGRRSMLRRIPQEVSDSLGQQDEQRRAERREQRREANASGAQPSSPEQGTAGAERAGRRERGANAEGRGGRGGRGGGGGGGRNLMQMLENLPALTLDELKKGDAVIVTVTTNDRNGARGTAVTLLTGDPAFLARLRRFQGQGRGGRDGQSVSPGLPGDVIGGGVPNPRDQP